MFVHASLHCFADASSWTCVSHMRTVKYIAFPFCQVAAIKKSGHAAGRHAGPCQTLRVWQQPHMFTAADSLKEQATVTMERTFSSIILESSKSLSMASTSASLGVRVMKRPVILCMRCILGGRQQLRAAECDSRERWNDQIVQVAGDGQ